MNYFKVQQTKEQTLFFLSGLAASQCTDKKMNLKQQAISIFAIQEL